MIEDASLHLRPEITRELKVQAERIRRSERPDYLSASVRDVATPAVMMLPSTSISQALRMLKRTAEMAGLVVESDERLIGITTLADLAFEADAESVTDVMSDPEVVRTEDTLADVLRWMLVRDFHQVPVVDDEDHAVGIVRVDDVLREITGPYASQIARRPAEPPRGYAPRYGA